MISVFGFHVLFVISHSFLNIHLHRKIDDWDVSRITSMYNLFEEGNGGNCEPAISNWDVSGVVDFVCNKCIHFGTSTTLFEYSPPLIFYCWKIRFRLKCSGRHGNSIKI